MSPADIAYAIAVLTLAYFVRGISGFGSGLIAVPLLALRFPLPEVVPFMLIADFGASALIGGLHVRNVAWGEIRRLLPGTLVGVVLGSHLLVSLPRAWLLGLLAAFVAVFGARAVVQGPRDAAPISPLWAWPAAFTGGAVSGLFGTGGPPYVIYLSHRLMDKQVLRATLSALFFIEGGLRIVAFLAIGLLHDARTWQHAALAAPLIVLALWAGGHVHARLSDRQMQAGIGWLLLGCAAALLGNL